MTDHNREDREALIEKARAEAEATKNSYYANAPLLFALADALEAAEQAHTPTSDERDESLEEALAYLDTLNADRQIWYDDYRNLHDLVSSATRHPEVPEPQAEPTDAEGTGQPTNHEIRRQP